MQIAPLQKQELEFLRSTLKNLESVVGRDTRSGFRVLSERLDQWAAKVAVIGQVKAGKSTFLNAFLHQHDFLPSDVNPWTSVVTNIRINMTNEPATGASFEFFDEADWTEIIEGSSKVRKLTEQLLPGFDSDVLRRQTEEMKDRAQRRLGKHYHALLGTSHDYDFLTSDLLKRYVCAGPGSDDGLDRESLGRYAAITKVANVYMNLPEFQVPVILTDTPGVNDPFLVRDEFTCRSLDKSDVFIVVLSAHQALTDVDVALINILAQQDSKDVIIFINRIDELDDYSTQVPRVINDVSRRLTRAIPDMEFTIRAGSAFMADIAMRGDEESRMMRDQLDTPQLHAYLEETYGEVPEDQVDRLIMASGLDDVKRTLSTVIDNGVGCQQLNQILEDTRAEISGAQFITKRERNSVQMQVEKIGVQNSGDAVAQLEAEIAAIQAVQNDVEGLFEAANDQIDKIVTKSWSALEQSLNASIERFVDDQRPALKERLLRDTVNGKKSKSLAIDLMPLRESLDKEIKKNYTKSRAGTDVVLNNCLEACRMAITNKLDTPTDGISLNDLPYEEFVSTLTLSKKSLDVALIADRGWAFWKRSSINIEKTLDAMRTIAAAELRPAIEKILKAFNEAQVEHATAGCSRIRVMLRMIDTSIAERTQRFKKDKRQLEEVSNDPDRLVHMSHRLQSQLEVLERRLQHLSITDSTLSKAMLPDAA
ncbi:dynamin family protein [Actibacterium lipolyticum]|uniref:GTP-binding protein Der n=1 Tax=Actibacterium lipolyticum TaxID=1524263 RepID=A0A238L865_9RHOB|nr:dynamin family protein [Actibacterium lipolyticum]SMX51285.1 GTP-binding protein Der [Actibacterium lipolyticum]